LRARPERADALPSVSAYPLLMESKVLVLSYVLSENRFALFGRTLGFSANRSIHTVSGSVRLSMAQAPQLF
jgi:hypothetical protein